MTTTTFSPPPSDHDDREGEAVSAAEYEATAEPIPGTLCGETIYVPPIKFWRSSGLKALREGDMEGWAESVLSDDDYATWQDVDPNLVEIGEFFENLGDKLGSDQGNSRASRRSSRSTAKR